MSATLVRTSTGHQTPATGADGDRPAFRSDRQPSPRPRTSDPAPPPHHPGSDDKKVSSAPLASSGGTAAAVVPETRVPAQGDPAIVSSGTTAAAKARSLPRMEPPAPAPTPARRSARQYIALARPVLVKRLLAHLDGVAAHAQTPSAGVYVYYIDRLATDALERFFDDGFLDLLLAVRNALTISNAWMRYTTAQIQSIQALIRKCAPLSADNGRAFRHGILELNQLGIDTTPFDVPAELLFDEQE